MSPATGITYYDNGNVQTVTENGVTTTYTYNPTARPRLIPVSE
ncbi:MULTISPECIES: hypothetical protein [unclassified Gordonia (in: high G+C Gram-positive bacteria)]|nr:MULTISPECIES: hypothetical protein [unclassified Gordonia (in: high G+C Gram-positive bacteria)]